MKDIFGDFVANHFDIKELGKGNHFFIQYHNLKDYLCEYLGRMNDSFEVQTVQKLLK